MGWLASAGGVIAGAREGSSSGSGENISSGSGESISSGSGDSRGDSSGESSRDSSGERESSSSGSGVEGRVLGSNDGGGEGRVNRSGGGGVGGERQVSGGGGGGGGGGGERRVKGQLTLGDLLATFEAESDPRLPPFYLRTDEVARAGRGLLHGLPPRDAWLRRLRARGFAATRSHVNARGLKTDAPMADVVDAANAVFSGGGGGGRGAGAGGVHTCISESEIDRAYCGAR